jgi:hypothetical protein
MMYQPQQTGVVIEMARAMEDRRFTPLDMQRILDAALAFGMSAIFGIMVGTLLRDFLHEALEPEEKKAIRPAIDVVFPATEKRELLVRYTGGPQRFGFPVGLEGEARNFAGWDWVILDTPRNRKIIRETKQWTIARHQPAHLQRRLLPSMVSAHTAEQIFARAKEYFGATTNPEEAGYILPDGTMLDFSGEKYAPPRVCRVAPVLMAPGRRELDHREIAFAWPEDDSPGGFDAMAQVMNWGAVRFSIYHETVVVNLVKPPTEAQKTAIDRALWYNPDAVLVVEVDDSKLDQIDYQEFTHPFTSWKAFVERTAALGRPTGLGLMTQTSLLPQALPEKDYREQAHQVLDDVLKAIDETRKADSIRRIERVLDRSKVEHLIVGADDLREAIADYRGVEREGLTPEEYIEEKESAFEAVVEAAEGLDIDEDALEEIEEPKVAPPVANELRRRSIEVIDRLIKEKHRDPNWEKWPHATISDARKAVYKDILGGFSTVVEAKEYVEGLPEDNVIFTARGDEISFFFIKLIIADIERNPWLSPFRPERKPDISWQPPLIPKTGLASFHRERE